MLKQLRIALIITAVAIAIGGALVGRYLLSNQLSIPPAPGVKGIFLLHDPPALNQTATLTYVITPRTLGRENELSCSVGIVLPEGFVWVGEIPEGRTIVDNRTLLENITLVLNQPIEISGTIKAVQTGVGWHIRAYGLMAGGGSGFGSHLYVTVTENSAWVENAPSSPPLKNENLQPLPFTSVPRPPLSVNLSLSDPPVLGRVVDLSCDIESAFDAPDVTAQVELPDAFAVVSGDKSWRGKIEKSSKVEFTLKVKALEVGDYEIRTLAELVNGEHRLKDRSYLYVEVGENDASVSYAPPPPKLELVELSESEIPPEYRETARTQLQSSSLTITGRVLYKDEHDYSRPLKWAKIKIFDKEWWGWSLLTELLTDANGEFTYGPISNVDSEFGESGTLDIVVQIFAQNGIVNVKSPGWLGGTYYATWYDSYDVPDGVLDLGNVLLGADETQQGIGRILTYVNNAWEYLYDTVNYDMPEITVEYPTAGTGYVVYYLWGIEIGKWIEVEVGYNRSRDILQHEYGHYIMHMIRGVVQPPDYIENHFIESASNATTAWSEGWADFYPLAVQNDPYWAWGCCENFMHAHYGGRIGLELDADMLWFDTGDTVEGRVAASLWDIIDSNNDGSDTISLPFSNIWVLFSDTTRSFNTFAEFWQQWRSIYSGNAEIVHGAKAAIYQNTIDYNWWTPWCSIENLTGTW